MGGFVIVLVLRLRRLLLRISEGGGGGRFGGKGGWVELSETASTVMRKGRSVEGNDMVEMDEWMRRIAEEDGYPFAPGKGSEPFISNEELMDTSL